MLPAILLLAATALASPIEIKKTAVLPLKHHANVTSMRDVVERARRRLKGFNSRKHGEASKLEDRASSGTVTNHQWFYSAGVDIGGKTWQLALDSGSSITWCGAHTPCEKSATGTSTGNSVRLQYADGSGMSGTQYTDRVTFAGLTVKSQSFGSASTTNGWDSYTDGLLGLGPVALTSGCVGNTTLVPTFMDNLYKQGSISTEAIGIYFKPEAGSDMSDNNGELTLGGYDASRFQGSLHYFPKLSNQYSPYWGLAVGSFVYGETKLDSNLEGLVDTGASLILISYTAFYNWMQATGGHEDQHTGLAAFTTQPTGMFYITLSGTTFSLTPAQYLVPQAQYANLGLNSSLYYSWIGNSFAESGETSVLLGQKFIENFYTVLDTTNSQIGFAQRV